MPTLHFRQISFTPDTSLNLEKGEHPLSVEMIRVPFTTDYTIEPGELYLFTVKYEDDEELPPRK